MYKYLFFIIILFCYSYNLEQWKRQSICTDEKDDLSWNVIGPVCLCNIDKDANLCCQIPMKPYNATPAPNCELFLWFFEFPSTLSLETEASTIIFLPQYSKRLQICFELKTYIYDPNIQLQNTTLELRINNDVLRKWSDNDLMFREYETQCVETLVNSKILELQFVVNMEHSTKQIFISNLNMTN